MTESNGMRGAQAEAWANRQPLGIPEPQGPFYPTQASSPQPVSDSFDAGDLWKVHYNLRPYVNAEGDVPPPSQVKIDKYQRTMSVLLIEADKADREASKPTLTVSRELEAARVKLRQAREEGDDAGLKKWHAEVDRLAEALQLTEEQVDKALADKAEIISKFKDAVAELCSNKPTRKQLEALPENVLKAFMNYLGRHLDPEG